MSRHRQEWGASIVRDLRQAARSLARTRTFTVVTVVSLGVGFALATLTFALTHAYLLRGVPYAGAERIYHVRYAPPGPTNLAA